MPPPTAKKKAFRLSPSALNLYRDCPRCFWLEKVKGIKRPRGIYPSLPTGMDRVIKDYFDTYRAKGALPPEFNPGRLPNLQLYSNQKQLDLWRDWKTGPALEEPDGSTLSGALDDLLVCDGKYIPFDYKTKGEALRDGDAERYGERYYQNQIDCYALLLERNGLPQAEFGYLVFYTPKQVRENGWVGFNVMPVRVMTDTSRALKTFRQAVELLKGPIPQIAPNCEYCGWLNQFEPARSFEG